MYNNGIYKLQRVERIVAKGEIAVIEHFFLLSQCFQSLFAEEVTKSLCVGKSSLLAGSTGCKSLYMLRCNYFII